MSTETKEEYKSLFEYLGKPAGKEIAGEVYKAAKEQSIPIEAQEISNKNYTGKVMTYPTSFLDSHFNIIPSPDDLPF